MSKKYHLDPNNAAFIHLVNSAFAGVHALCDMLKEKSNDLSKEETLELIKGVLAKTNTAVTSEYIRGELIKKNVLENGDDTGLCVFDPSDDNKDSEAEVFTNEELKNIRLENK